MTTKNFTIMETRKMSKCKLQTEIGLCEKRMEALGMNCKDACEFVSSIMNLGIAMQEKLQSEAKLKNCYGKNKIES